MIESRTISLCVAIVLLAATTQLPAQTATARERVAPQGPYRSQVRLLDEEPVAATDTQQALAEADDYGRALILRQLALGAIANGDNPGAIDALEKALQLDSLAPLAQGQMHANLGQLYLAAGRAEAAAQSLRQAVATDIADPMITIALAGAELELRHFAAAADAALAAIAARADAPDDWLRIAVYALSKAGRADEAGRWQARLLQRAPDDPLHWSQLAALYADAGDPRRAAATLAAASAGGVVLTPEHRLQAAQWLAAAGIPDAAAQQLEAAISERAEAQYWQWLAQLRLAAHDGQAALLAWQQTASMTGNAADWLATGELALTLGATDAAIDALRRATGSSDDGATRARALLLLGQTYADTGRLSAARRTLSSATEYGGSVYRAATQQLDALAAPVEPLAGADEIAIDTETQAAPVKIPALALQTKTVPSLRVYLAREQADAASLVDTATALVRDLLRTSRRDRLEWTGPLHLVFRGDITDRGATIELDVAAPIRRVAPSRGRFRSGELDAFRCAWLRYTGPWEQLDPAWREFYRQVVAAGYEPGDEARQVVLHRGGDKSDSVVELQIGIL